MVAGEESFLVLDSHTREAGVMDLRGLQEYICYSKDNAPGGHLGEKTYLEVVWARATAPPAPARDAATKRVGAYTFQRVFPEDADAVERLNRVYKALYDEVCVCVRVCARPWVGCLHAWCIL